MCFSTQRLCIPGQLVRSDEGGDDSSDVGG